MIKGLTVKQHWDAIIETWIEIAESDGIISKDETVLNIVHKPLHGCFACELFLEGVELDKLCEGCPFRITGRDSPLACEYQGSPYQDYRAAKLKGYKPETIKKHARRVVKLFKDHYPNWLTT